MTQIANTSQSDKLMEELPVKPPRIRKKKDPDNTALCCSNTITDADLNEAENFNSKPREELGGNMSLSDLDGIGGTALK